MSPVFLVFMLKNRPEPNKTGSVWTDSRFGSGYINKKYYFLVRLNFWVKTGPNRTVNTPSYYNVILIILVFISWEPSLLSEIEWQKKLFEILIL
jgi:hypothetical protein